ncbi:LOW QUALITY PROTEIN: V-set and transmembrane domain-containing protein 2-like protein [Gadus macrocephalus]|uniref:LOW QUALITY PROTEIN: V-set and transmembrane domain-containing protein 2-like protein n=1 Tax=Gadus macrocephalus TaxID=80720 RepID=UPI0028CB2C98|nr:LOW QUALITY PROTEIN: V-set and transmembrane domain-containing protein 2-like protein [Gadus macrocephalus]
MAVAVGDRCHEQLGAGTAMFTEVPRDVWALGGQDVEMACSFRGAGTPSYSLEIQWWYIRNRPDWTDSQPWSTNEVSPGEGLPKDATKISVVKVAGSNISHKLRLSSVRPRDEGTYECRVIDFSDAAGARHHRARAYLQVAPQGRGPPPPRRPRRRRGTVGHGTQPSNHGQGQHARDKGHAQGHQTTVPMPGTRVSMPGTKVTPRDWVTGTSMPRIMVPIAGTRVPPPTDPRPRPQQQSQADGEPGAGPGGRDVLRDCLNEPRCVP